VVERALKGRERAAPFEFIRFPADSERFFRTDGWVAVGEVERLQL
jgi:hypothetical protein